MAKLSIRNITYIAQKLDNRLGEAFEDLIRGVNNITDQIVSNPSGPQSPPPTINGLSVLAADGIFDVAITDNNAIQRGIIYFIEYSTTPQFSQPSGFCLGPWRTWRGQLGKGTLYWRAYSQYPSSDPSTPVYFGNINIPTPVAGGGTLAGPSYQASTGSGTATGNGSQGGSGYGKVLFRS